MSSAGTVQLTTLMDGVQIERTTAKSYDALLELLFATEQVPAWSTNRIRRLTKASKRYVVDPAHLGPLLGVDVRGAMRNADLVGRLVDTFVVAQLRPELEVCLPGVRMYHLRTDHGRQEVDLLLEAPNGRIVAIEVKATASPERSDARHLLWLRDQLGESFATGVVFHAAVTPSGSMTESTHCRSRRSGARTLTRQRRSTSTRLAIRRSPCQQWLMDVPPDLSRSRQVVAPWYCSVSEGMQ